MLVFSPCLELFFDFRPFTERMEAIASLGYTHYEFWSWWDKDLSAIGEMNEKLGLTPQAFCTRFISLVDKNLQNAYLTCWFDIPINLTYDSNSSLGTIALFRMRVR